MQRQGAARYIVTPRTLLFLERAGEWLFIQGAGHKWWAGRLNGIGGSVEAGEGILAAARREAEEETGLVPSALHLTAIVHVTSDPAVLLFVFLGILPAGDLAPCGEGTFHWLTPAALDAPDLPLMPDLPHLLPRLWAWKPGQPPLSLRLDLTDGPRLTED